MLCNSSGKFLKACTFKKVHNFLKSYALFDQKVHVAQKINFFNLYVTQIKNLICAPHGFLALCAKIDQVAGIFDQKVQKVLFFQQKVLKNSTFCTFCTPYGKECTFGQKARAKIGRAASNFCQAHSCVGMDCLQLFQFLHFCCFQQKCKKRVLRADLRVRGAVNMLGPWGPSSSWRATIRDPLFVTRNEDNDVTLTSLMLPVGAWRRLRRTGPGQKGHLGPKMAQMV